MRSQASLNSFRAIVCIVIAVLDARSGGELYRFNTGGPIGGGIVTYAAAGKQYIVVATGSAVNQHLGSPTIVVFALLSAR